MSSNLWQLDVDGDRRTLAEWGIRNPVLTRLNRGTDTLEFHVPTASVYDEPPFEHGLECSLWRGDVRWFAGESDDPVAGASAAGEGHAIRIVGPWRVLEEIIYEQPTVYRTFLPSGLTGGTSTRVVLAQDPWGRKMTINAQISAILSWARSQGGEFATVAALDNQYEPPYSEARDITCGSALQRMLDLVPDSVVWFNYANLPRPQLIMKRRSALAAVTIDASDGACIEGLSTLRKRTDLQARGVVLKFLETQVEEEDDRAYLKAPTTQTAGATTGRRVIRATIQLGEGESVPSGMAAAYYSAVNDVHFSGAITLKERECSGLVRPGNKLNLSNGKAAWAAMNAVVQQTVEHLDSGRTEVSLGPPDRLGPLRFAEIYRALRERTQLSDWHRKRHNGTEGVDDGASEAGVDGFGGGAPDVDPGDREGNSDAARPPGGAGTGTSSALGGRTVAVKVCVDGVEQTHQVVKAN